METPNKFLVEGQLNPCCDACSCPADVQNYSPMCRFVKSICSGIRHGSLKGDKNLDRSLAPYMTNKPEEGPVCAFQSRGSTRIFRYFLSLSTNRFTSGGCQTSQV